MFSLDTIIHAVTSDDVIVCPHCGKEEPISDPDVCSAVVSYWGDGDPHDFSCGSCGKDFLVSERVTRKFRTFRTLEEMNSQ